MALFSDLSASGSFVLVGLIFTAACIVLISDWRLALLTLAFQYVLLGFLLATIVQPSVAIVRVLSGGITAAILFVSMEYRSREIRAARRAARERGPEALPQPPPVFTVSAAFRLFAVALTAVTLIGFSSSMSFLGLPAYVLFGSLWLMSIGLLIAMVSRDVLRLGLGILAFTGGFGILETAIEGSLFLYGLVNISDLLIALVLSHLATLTSEGEANRQ